MSDSTEQQDNSTEQQSVKSLVISKAEFLKTGCGCLMLGAIIAIAGSWALVFGAPYAVECKAQGQTITSIRKFGDMASADAYYAGQVAAGKTCTKKYR
ncbi:hypothetical protein [Oscillatoria sp. FACHB-1406]|uniref:hypothetical protein n=1 Tax=Oscillatoria sp. FACHB-1406 TaxID=2692846 RepID=UPI001685098D|nr:hypothetical protein [Oscillatoria sp. FACHB-1406]MBD2578154.1 hypothetical protein [Oscillatoria sp. FACHB-1406]